MNYKFCPRCGHRIPINAQYCKYCGLQQNVIINKNRPRGQVVSHTHYWIIGIISVLVGLIVIASIFFGVIRNPKIMPSTNFRRQLTLNDWCIKSRWYGASNPPHREIVKFMPDNKIYSKISSGGQSFVFSGRYKLNNNKKKFYIYWYPEHNMGGHSDNYHLVKYNNNHYYIHAVNSYGHYGKLQFIKMRTNKSL